MSVSHFLKGLPTVHEKNFSKFQADSSSKQTSTKRPSVYQPAKDHPSEQIITTEKTNILLRFLHQQWERKTSSTIKKRDVTRANLQSEDEVQRKKPRLDPSAENEYQ